MEAVIDWLNSDESLFETPIVRAREPDLISQKARKSP